MRIVWRPLAALLLCLAFTPVQAQDNAPGRGFHLPGGGAAPLPSAGSFDSVDEANEVVRRITVSVGVVSPNFTVLASDQLGNAAAWIGGNKRYIGYQPAFMKSILTKAGKNYFSLIGIVAHEVGHHFLGHTTDDLTAAASQAQPGGRGLIGLAQGVKEADWLAQRRRDELDADYFSGFVLAKLGATKAEASGWLAAVPDPGEGGTHPRNSERKAKIEEGWTEATGKVTDARAALTAKYWDHNGSKMKLVTSDARVLFFYEQPRKAIADRGVEKGTLLFDGQIEGKTVEGLIYAFSFKCGKFGYLAKGTASGNLIELTGLHPTINDNCEIVRQQEEKLIFVAE
jgi:hypothetical protein